MRKILIVSSLVILLTPLHSCAVVNALLGYDECNYPNCTRQIEHYKTSDKNEWKK